MKATKRLLALLLAVMFVVGAFAVQAATIQYCPYCGSNSVVQTNKTVSYGSRHTIASGCSAAPNSNNHTHIPGTTVTTTISCSYCGYSTSSSRTGEWCTLANRLL